MVKNWALRGHTCIGSPTHKTESVAVLGKLGPSTALGDWRVCSIVSKFPWWPIRATSNDMS